MAPCLCVLQSLAARASVAVDTMLTRSLCLYATLSPPAQLPRSPRCNCRQLATCSHLAAMRGHGAVVHNDAPSTWVSAPTNGGGSLRSANTWPRASAPIQMMYLWVCTADSPTGMFFPITLASGCQGITAHLPPHHPFNHSAPVPRARSALPLAVPHPIAGHAAPPSHASPLSTSGSPSTSCRYDHC
jgi:hypothetical protein